MNATTILFSFLLASLTLSSCKKEPLDPDNNGSTYASMEVYKENAMGVIYNEATNSIAYNKPDGDGTYKIYISNYDGTGEVQLTYPGWVSNRHQWVEEWDPTGQYLYCYIEKTDYVAESGHTRTPEVEIP